MPGSHRKYDVGQALRSAGACTSTYFPEYPASVTSTGAVTSRRSLPARALAKSSTVGPTGTSGRAMSVRHGSLCSQLPRPNPTLAPLGGAASNSAGQTAPPSTAAHPSGTVIVKRIESASRGSLQPGVVAAGQAVHAGCVDGLTR